MDTSKIIIGTVGGGRYTVTAPIVKEDYGLYLQIEGIELPETYEVDFSNDEHSGTSVTMIGNADGVLIPSQFIKSGKDVFAFLYHVGADYGRTVFKFRIPNKLRPDRTDETPTPEEQSTIDQAISALNSAVEQTAQDVIDADASAQSASESAEQAQESARTAGLYSDTAQTYANSAEISANSASASATASAQSASQSAQIKADVEDMVDDAQASASASAQSATASANSASQASGYAQSASASAQSASGYASSAETSAHAASAKASEASASASTASQKASESAQSATYTQTYASQAETAKTDAQTAQGHAEQAKADAITAKDDAESARDEAQSIVDGISGKVEQIDSNTERIESLEDDRYKPYVVDSASGSIASFPDGADDIPLKSLVVNINPVQDLHGQDAPYPAGGGKNLCSDIASDYTKSSVYWVWHRTLEDGAYCATVTAKSRAETGYAVAVAKSGDDYAEFVNPIIVLATSGSTYDRNFTVDSTWTNPVIGIYCPSGKTISDFFANYTVQLEEGSTATAYAPYENICPISGWDEVNVTRTGKNLLNPDISTWRLRGSAYRYINGVVPEGQTARITLIDKDTSIDTSGISFGFIANDLSSEAATTYTWVKNRDTINSNATNVARNGNVGTLCRNVFIYPQSEAAFNALFARYYVMVELGSTATAYEPYQGNTYTIEMPSEAGTVYGGKLDVLSGELTVDMAIVDLGTLTWTKSATTGRTNDRWVCNAPNDAAVTPTPSNKANFVCENYATLTANDTWFKRSTGISALNRSIYIYDPNTLDMTSAEFKSAMNGVQLCYELAEPIEIQLSANQINSLYGVNNLWADSGDTSAEYRADTKLYIERLTAPDSADMIADSNIVSGQYFMVGNTLYKATANIANGGQIVVGTNCTRVSLAQALNEINA